METNYENPRFCSIAAHRNVSDRADDHTTCRSGSASGNRAYADTNPGDRRTDARSRARRHDNASTGTCPRRDHDASTGTRCFDHAHAFSATSRSPDPDNGTDGIKPAACSASRISALFSDGHRSVHPESDARTQHQAQTSRLTLTETRGIG
jgi:hypothetical protein